MQSERNSFVQGTFPVEFHGGIELSRVHHHVIHTHMHTLHFFLYATVVSSCWIVLCSHMQLTGKCGSVLVRLIPAPRGTGIVAAGVPKKLLNMAGVSDCYTSARGQTATLGNFGKISLVSAGI